MPFKIENIVFDLDGTLTDPKQGIINSILFALKRLGIQEDNTKELEKFIGSPLKIAFMDRYRLSEDLGAEAVLYFREYYSNYGLFENSIYDGAKALLKTLSTQRRKLFLATSKPTVFAERILKYFDINNYFIDVIGSNLDNTRSDKTEIISHVSQLHKLQKRKTLVVGDRKYDIIGAKNNSIKSMGVTYGYGTLDELLSHSPDYIVNTFEEILSTMP